MSVTNCGELQLTSPWARKSRPKNPSDPEVLHDTNCWAEVAATQAIHEQSLSTNQLALIGHRNMHEHAE